VSIHWPSGWHYQRVCHALDRGGVVAYPTEGVFGLGCNPWDPKAVERLWRVKKRCRSKGFILLSHNQQVFEPLLELLPCEIREAINRSWPGPVTWVIPVQGLPSWLTGGFPGIALRVTDHPVAARLCARWGGALISTSANISGQKPAVYTNGVRIRFGNKVDAILPGNVGSLGRTTPIFDALTGNQLRD